MASGVITVMAGKLIARLEFSRLRFTLFCRVSIAYRNEHHHEQCILRLDQIALTSTLSPSEQHRCWRRRLTHVTVDMHATLMRGFQDHSRARVLMPEHVTKTFATKRVFLQIRLRLETSYLQLSR